MKRKISDLQGLLTAERMKKVLKNPKIIFKIFRLRLTDPVIFNLFYKSKEKYKLKFCDIETEFSALDKFSKYFLSSRFRKGDVHEPVVLKMIFDSLNQDGVFVDVGTHIGLYSCIVGKFLRNGKVYGFEVNKSAFDVCKRNINLNGLKNIETFNVAVSDSEGYIKIPEVKEIQGGYAIKNKEQGIATMPMKAISLDSFFEKREKPKVIKIDVEGAELLVLKGMEKILIKKPKIFLELHGGRLNNFDTSSDEIISFLIDRGYALHEIRNHKEKSLRNGEGRLKEIKKGNLINYTTMIYAHKK
ncbi:MAG: FkbM family methyltransferase [Candidatus Pacearchaeota archaeon]